MSEPQTLLQVAVPGPKGRLLSYAPPSGHEAEMLIGCRVQVRIGPRSTIGVVVGVVHEAPPRGLRAIEDVLDASPSVPPDLLELTRWIADYYLCDWVDVLRAALPAGLLHPPALVIEWNGPELEGQWPTEVQNQPTLSRIARAVAGRGKLSFQTLMKRTGRLPGLLAGVRDLAARELLTLTDRIALQRETTQTLVRVRLVEDADPAVIPERAKARKRLFELLAAQGGEGEWGELKREAHVERGALNALLEAGLVTVQRVPKATFAAGFDPRGSGTPHPLSGDQQTAIAAVGEALETGEFHPFLLTGLPGSGKTRVFVEAIRKTLALGKGALVLVPEIGLTPQVVARIRAALDEPVAVLHSGLTGAQRVGAWRDVLEGRTRVVVGPRSAIFAPIANLGLIVVDEEHEESYKQQEPAPRYHARDVALVRGRNLGASVMLVSATPSLESLRLSEEGALRRLRLKERFGAGWPVITVVDRRRESPDAPYVGPHLAREIETRAKNGEGIVLLITRRGFAPVLTCTDCGHRLGCPHCEITLTYHRTKEPFLRCHMCGYSRRVPERCPECQGENLLPLGAGTQRIEEEIQRRFPALAPIRMDSDTTRNQGEHERILRQFGEGDAQLLLGTQVVAKGHDFSHVTLVGVVNADPALAQPDFRSEERTFRLLVQAAGRAGRGDAPGEMIVQTLAPEHDVFTRLFEPDIDGFLQRQSTQRKALGYPPYARMAMLTVTGSINDRAERAALGYAQKLREQAGAVTVRGPVQAYVPKVKRQWRWRILLSTPRDRDPSGAFMRAMIRRSLSEVHTEHGVQTVVDMDPLEVA